MHRELERTIDSIVDDTVGSKFDCFATDLAERLRAECTVLVEQIRKLDSQEPGESLVKLLDGLQRIQRAGSVVNIAGALIEASSAFCGRAALLINRGDSLLGFRLAGAETESRQKAFQDLSLDLPRAVSFAVAVDSADNVVASGSAAELSSKFVNLMDLSPDDRVGLFPVRLRSRVLAVLYCDAKGADGKSAPMQSAAIEALVSAAEGWIEAVSTRKRKSVN